MASWNNFSRLQDLGTVTSYLLFGSDSFRFDLAEPWYLDIQSNIILMFLWQCFCFVLFCFVLDEINIYIYGS